MRDLLNLILRRCNHPFRVIKRQFGHVTVRYQMLARLFHFVCHNGLVYGDTAADIHIPHTASDSN